MIKTLEPLSLILDTDIGDDIDDALALGLILNSPELNLRGVTTVFVNTAKRAQLAQKVLSTWGRSDIPVAAGCSQPLLQPFEKELRSQFQILREPPKSTFTHGVDFLVNALETVNDIAPGQKLTLLAIGPLTNVALALAREPGLAERARLVMMGGQGMQGSFGPEWNIICDPEAAAMVFRSGIEVWKVGYDITSQVQLNAYHLQQITCSDNPRVQLLAELLHLWQNGSDRRPFLHDPLAALALFTDCIEFEERTLDVELCGSRRGFLTYSPPGQDSPCARVAVGVDASYAVELFMQRILEV